MRVFILVTNRDLISDSHAQKEHKTEILHFASSLKQLCEEKKIAYKEYGINLEFEVNGEALSKAAHILESDFLRVCSNLLRNSFEATESKFIEKSVAKSQ